METKNCKTLLHINPTEYFTQRVSQPQNRQPARQPGRQPSESWARIRHAHRPRKTFIVSLARLTDACLDDDEFVNSVARTK